MLVQPSKISGMYFIDPKVFADARGHFYEVFQTKRFREHGLPDAFVQDNHSRSARGTVRGLHYQIRHPQGKLLRVVRGSIFDVAVDLRNGSPTFGRSVTVELSEENRRQVYIPPGCAHGFCALREDTELVYKCTDLYYPEYECTLLWNDPALEIDWPIKDPLLSEKDCRGVPLSEAPYYDFAIENAMPAYTDTKPRGL